MGGFIIATLGPHGARGVYYCNQEGPGCNNKPPLYPLEGQGCNNKPPLLWLGWLACCAQPWLGLAWACLACLACLARLACLALDCSSNNNRHGREG